MAVKTKATAVKISERDAQGYHYAGKGMRRNGGVTAIAAINGRGAYAANLKAREVTEGKPPSLARKAAGKALDYVTQEPLVIRMHPIRKLQKKLTTKVEQKIARSEPAMLNKNSGRGKRPPTPAQLAARKRFAAMAKSGVFKKASLRRNGTAASWAKPSLGSVENVRRMRRNAARIIPGELRRSVARPGALPRFALPGEGIDLDARTRVMPRRSIKATAKPKARKTRKIRTSPKARKAPTASASARAQEKPMKTRKRRSKTSAAAKVSTAKRRIKAKKATTVKKTVTKAVKRSRAAKKAARTRKAAPKRARKGAKASRRIAAPKKVRKSTKRKARRTAKQKAAAMKNLRKARASLRSAAPKRRRARKGAARKAVRSTRKATRRSKSRRGFRKNGRFTHGRMRRNDAMGAFSTALKVGTIAGIGFFSHKVATALLNGLVIDKAVSATVQAAAENSTTAPAAAGLGAFSPLIGGFIGGGAVLGLGVVLSSKFIESEDTRRLVLAGMVASYAQTLLVSLLEKVAPQAAPMLSGGEASRMSAMYGVDPASILPRYAPISGTRGVGEYFAQNGLGEYFGPTAGLGEYFAQSGLGAYEGNPNIMQAAAGYGALNGATNHLDPSSDLERELSIAEAAAGVGNIDYAAAGMGDIYQASAGLGAINSVPSVDTNIPSGQLWAGVRSVDAGDNSENPAGILSTQGGSGIFG